MPMAINFDLEKYYFIFLYFIYFLILYPEIRVFLFYNPLFFPEATREIFFKILFGNL